jgi:rubrerythrin
VQLALAAQARRAYHPAVDFGACRYCGEDFADDTIIVCPFCDEERD